MFSGLLAMYFDIPFDSNFCAAILAASIVLITLVISVHLFEQFKRERKSR